MENAIFYTAFGCLLIKCSKIYFVPPRSNTNTHPAGERLSWLRTILYQVSIIVWMVNKAGWHLIRSPVIIHVGCLSGTARSSVTPLGGEREEERMLVTPDTTAGDRQESPTSWDHIPPLSTLRVTSKYQHLHLTNPSPPAQRAPCHVGGELSVEFLVYFLKTPSPQISPVCDGKLISQSVIILWWTSDYKLMAADSIPQVRCWLLGSDPDRSPPHPPGDPLMLWHLGTSQDWLAPLPQDQTVTARDWQLPPLSKVWSLKLGLLPARDFCVVTFFVP